MFIFILANAHTHTNTHIHIHTQTLPCDESKTNPGSKIVTFYSLNTKLNT